MPICVLQRGLGTSPIPRKNSLDVAHEHNPPRKLGDTATSAQVLDYLSNQTDLAGINRIYNFKAVPQRGLDNRSSLVSRSDPVSSSWAVASAPAGELLR
jgi:hypothetical protein